jgi:alkaline phosphatase D
MKYFLMFLLILLSSCSQLPRKRTDKLSILQGLTNPKEVEFSILAPKSKSLKFELRSAEGEIINPDEIKVISKDYSPYNIHKVVFLRDPKKDYNIYVFENGKVIDQRLIGRGQTHDDRLRVAVASCMNDHFPENFGIWNTLAAKNPEYLLLIGDNVYADKGSSGESISINPEKLWNRYIDVRLTLPLYFMEKLIPIHAVWDDHDYGQKDGGEKFEYKENSKKIFESFFAQDLSSEDWVNGFGIGGKLSLGDFNLYFLDGRSFRSVNQDGRHLGLDQEHWLVQNLQEELKPSFIIKGDQFFGGYHEFDSFEGKHPTDFVNFINKLKLTKTPFIFLSGDRHMSEIMQFPRGLFDRPSFEITSSPIHGKLYPGNAKNKVNPWRVVAEDSHMNFTIIDSLAQNDHWFLDVENFGENGALYYKRELAVFIKDLQNNLNEVRKRRHGRRRYRRGKR